MPRFKTKHAEGAGFAEQLNVKIPKTWVLRLKALAKLNRRTPASEHRALLEAALGPNATVTLRKIEKAKPSTKSSTK